MATTSTAFRAQVKILLGPDDTLTELGDVDLSAMIKAALERYSHDRPDEVTADVSGDGGRYYDIAASLTSWSEGFSRIVSIEYPAQAITADDVPQYLSKEDWQDDYFDGATRYLFLPNHVPAATETMRIIYTAPYTFSAESVDTPPGDFYAICNLAAGLSCEAIATRYSRTSDSTIALDSVGHTTRAQEFSARARNYLKYYNEHMGLLADQRNTAAGAFVDLDTAPSWPLNRRYLYHGGETR